MTKPLKILDCTLRESHQTANDKAITSKIRTKINSLLQSTILTPQIGGMTSISQEPSEIIQQDRIPESSMRNSSKPGGRGSGYSISPAINLTIHVPQLPDVQLVGILIPILSATSTMKSPSSTSAEPKSSPPRKKRMIAMIGPASRIYSIHLTNIV